MFRDKTTKNDAVHLIKWSKSGIAQTWCGVDPYRKGVQCSDQGSPSTCKACLREEERFEDAEADREYAEDAISQAWEPSDYFDRGAHDGGMIND